MRRLNFYPFYKDHLYKREKTTTIRLSSEKPYYENEDVIISVGWDENKSQYLRDAQIKKVYKRRICDLDSDDFAGESPDCKTVEATLLVLSCIYRKVLTNSDEVWVVKFEHK